jgi:hypothetical protein
VDAARTAGQETALPAATNTSLTRHDTRAFPPQSSRLRDFTFHDRLAFAPAIPCRRLRGYFYPGTNETSVGERPHALQGTPNFLLHGEHSSSFLTAGGQQTQGQTPGCITAESATGAHRFSGRKASARSLLQGALCFLRMPKRRECGRNEPMNAGPEPSRSSRTRVEIPTV